VLIERPGFLASLEGLLGEALGGSGRLVFLGGEAGVGKTTLAATLADAALAGSALAGSGAGLSVRRGCCDSVTTAEALGPIRDALPELAAAIDRADSVTRLRLFREVREKLSAAPVLLLLEDVHWADEATLDILRFLGRRLAGTRLMILATFRSEEVGRDHPLTVVMGDLAGQPGVVRMQVPALSAMGVRLAHVPAQPESLADPKQTIVNLARKSRKRAVKLGLVPEPGAGISIGPEYAAWMIEFAQSQWEPLRAAANGTAPSLSRTLQAVKRLVRAAKQKYDTH